MRTSSDVTGTQIMKPQNTTTRRKGAGLSINIQPHRAEAEETTDIS